MAYLVVEKVREPLLTEYGYIYSPEPIDIDNDRDDELQKADERKDPRREQDQEDGEAYNDLAMRGWKMWAGAWKSTPIGVVAN